MFPLIHDKKGNTSVYPTGWPELQVVEVKDMIPIWKKIPDSMTPAHEPESP